MFERELQSCTQKARAERDTSRSQLQQAVFPYQQVNRGTQRGAVPYLRSETRCELRHRLAGSEVIPRAQVEGKGTQVVAIGHQYRDTDRDSLTSEVSFVAQIRRKQQEYHSSRSSRSSSSRTHTTANE
ncbi:unnamed protein product [Cercospora beticola]|nr:unnamed protein product [Cercospora beticola]